MKKKNLFIILGILCIGICICGLTNINEQNMKQETNIKDRIESVSGQKNESVQNEISQNQISSIDDALSWKWVIEPGEYQVISFANNGLILAENKEGKYGVLNLKGEIVIPFRFDYISKFNYRIAEAELNGEVFYINEEGEVLFGEKYDRICGFQEEMGAVLMGNLWGFINLNGEIAIPCQYNEVKNFSEGYAAVMKDGKWGFVDREGRFVIECIYNEVKDFQEGYAAVMKDGKWGFIDNTGSILIDLQFDDAGNFSEGKAAVKVFDYKDGMDAWAYINESGEIVIDYNFYFGVEGLMDYVGEFQNGVAFVSKEYYSIIDESGNDIFSGNNSRFFISSLNYNQEFDIIPAYIYADDAMKVRKYGLIGLYGEQRLEPIFDFIGDIDGKYIIVWNEVDDMNGCYTQGVIEIVQ